MPAVLLISVGMQAQAPKIVFEKYTLANGLTVNTRQTDPLPPEQCDPLRTPFQKLVIRA